jgi:hypothetical protein
LVEKAELRGTIEELLPSVNAAAIQAELRRLVADPRFHGRRLDELRVVLTSWGSGPPALEEITRGYRAWCSSSGRTECIARTLSDSDVYEVAFDFAIGAEWDGFVKEVKSTIDPATVRTVLLAGIVIFLATIAIPELLSKIPAAIATAILTAYIGAQAVCDLIFGWIKMVKELDAATSFDEVRAAGQRYGKVVGAQTARVLILLATAAVAEGGLIARLMKLPRAAEASAAMATETGGRLGLESMGAVRGASVVQNGVTITVGVVAEDAVGVAMAAHGPASGGASGLRAFTEDNFRENLARVTGGAPKGAQAHHVFPQKFAPQFRKAGINIHDPRYGVWWETEAHQRLSFSYNAEWDDFFKANPSPSIEQILQFGRDISATYGLRVSF